eukprot:1563874-Amphidinium_carterae.1
MVTSNSSSITRTAFFAVSGWTRIDLLQVVKMVTSGHGIGGAVTQTSLTSAKIHKNAVKCMQCARSGQKVLTGSDYEPARWSHLSGEEICELK